MHAETEFVSGVHRGGLSQPASRGPAVPASLLNICLGLAALGPLESEGWRVLFLVGSGYQLCPAGIWRYSNLSLSSVVLRGLVAT